MSTRPLSRQVVFCAKIYITKCGGLKSPRDRPRSTNGDSQRWGRLELLTEFGNRVSEQQPYSYRLPGTPPL